MFSAMVCGSLPLRQERKQVTPSKFFTMKVYTQFTDKFGKEYRFDNYMDFASFWFGLSYQFKKASFHNFQKLQSCAANSKEARRKA